jgi:FKBP-type peptidyl-prolyl cis-trans isomerase FkpA
MKTLSFQSYFTVLAISLLLMSCSGKKGGFQEHTSGLQYSFIEMNPRGKTPTSGDILLLSIKYFTEGGLQVDESSSYRLQLTKPIYQGDLYTGLAITQVGDSVHFILDAVNYYRNTRKRELPEEFVAGEKILIQIRLKSIVEVESLKAERLGIYHTDEEQELRLLKEFVSKANVQVEPSSSGLYVIILKEGSGPKAEKGQTLSVHYTGKTIDGKIFDSSLTRGPPMSFTLGKGKVIRGWEEGFAHLNKGARARFIIPSSLAYGKEGYGRELLPFSSLVFDVELLDFK